MEVRRRGGEPRRGGMTLAGPLIFLLVIWLGAYFAWRIIHGDRPEQGVVTHIVYPDTRTGRIAHGVFLPLRTLDERYLGVRSTPGGEDAPEARSGT
ncbi:hypothetical protein [Brevundimonas sp.]|uniref:hypothetical protein n=1 Tax=Brevundimonas sp. TaxID=1871086 RepID=UPI0025B9DBC3|nr:hypothetical protein [Brevundimonas sp.]